MIVFFALACVASLGGAIVSFARGNRVFPAMWLFLAVIAFYLCFVFWWNA